MSMTPPTTKDQFIVFNKETGGYTGLKTKQSLIRFMLDKDSRDYLFFSQVLYLGPSKDGAKNNCSQRKI